MPLPADWVVSNRDRLLDSGFDVDQTPGATAVHGPARLPLSSGDGWARARLWYAEYGRGRFVVAVVGNPRQEKRTMLRIESACVFGHLFGSKQCDCSWQWRSSAEKILSEGGVLLYAIDQDARGLGIAAHFDIYQLRQQERLDTDEVFRRLDAPWDNRDYAPVLELLRAVGVTGIRLLSNNKERVRVLEEGGFDVDRATAEAELTVANMSTLMLEKEDFGYEWSFRTHAEMLAPLQQRVTGSPEITAAGLARAGGPVTAEISGTWDSVGGAVVAAASSRRDENIVLYLTDLPRLQDLAAYASVGVQVLVVPYPTLPDILVDACEEVGIRLVDWSRKNRWDVPRAQWVPVVHEPHLDEYRLVSSDLHLAPPRDAPTITRSRG